MRISISMDALAKLAGLELQSRVACEDRFTAYDITRAIRRNNPQYDIPHEPIRRLVHKYMGNLIYMGRYQAHPANFGGRIAVLYLPLESLTLRNLLLVARN